VDDILYANEEDIRYVTTAPGYSSANALDTLEEVAAEVLPQGVGYAWANMSYTEKIAAAAIPKSRRLMAITENTQNVLLGQHPRSLMIEARLEEAEEEAVSTE
jgi:hypothetical protein